MCELGASRGAGVTLVAVNPQDVPEDWRNGKPGRPRLITIDEPSRFGRLSATARRTLEEVLGQADVLHLHNIWDPSGLTVAAMARRMRVPYVASTHGMLDD